MELYIIRHAQSTNNVLPHSVDRSVDPPLTDQGQIQSRLLARHLKEGVQRLPGPRGYGLTHLYCSPMWRALQTAQPISETLGLPVEVWIDAHEWGGIDIDAGDVEGSCVYPGKTRSEIAQSFPDYILPEEVTEKGWRYHGRKDKPNCMARAIRVAEALHQRVGRQERLAIITHGGFSITLIKALCDHLPVELLT